MACQRREDLARWMIENGFATGHGDTHAHLLEELTWQIRELRQLDDFWSGRLSTVIAKGAGNEVPSEASLAFTRAEVDDG